MGYGDANIDAMAKDIARALESIRDETLHEVSLVWNPPVKLSFPFFGGEPRLSPPLAVQCIRAVDPSGATFVTPGGCTWRWLGTVSSTAEVIDISGLVAGTRYDLVFSVVG